jgi:hypothetical protein
MKSMAKKAKADAKVFNREKKEEAPPGDFLIPTLP